MDLDALIGALRLERLDDTVTPPQYTTEVLTRAFNDAVRQVCIRKRLLLDRSTRQCCTVAIAADQASFRLHPRVLAIRSARFTGQRYPLRLTTLKVMDRDHPTWPDAPTGTPQAIIVDADTGKGVLWPTPDTAGTLQLAVWRVPLESEEMEDGADEPVIADHMHYDLLDWAEHLAYLTKDGEKGDAERAEAAASRFGAKFGRLPSAHEIQRWGVSPPRGQRAEFL